MSTSVAELHAKRPADGCPADQAVALSVPPGVKLQVSAEDFWLLACENPDLRLERTAEGVLLAMPPAGSEGGMLNARLTIRLGVWAEADGTGIVFDSSAGFTLPNSAVRAPDVSWMPRERWDRIPADDRRKFAHACPDFVAELRSPSELIADLRQKMKEYLAQGVRLGWLIDPIRGKAEVYRPGRPVEVLDRPATLSGEDVLPGFVLDLKGILFD
ncbi:hypothetical protein OJF2_43950 [Aquisphaera giovannonii]|uniref:Putative restriction endonuclease domain-containing protein n=1 Tax=Aquisphaera giovannonii TaxID=406548 RepID=A0A5B9W5G3_9BACT|nr:Uma2 family endonuclease [Aquisphaera giovannonii]QEH35838.1 hypothetical protein OJF2_43950 [Aquisphaera giovannonii]